MRATGAAIVFLLVLYRKQHMAAGGAVDADGRECGSRRRAQGGGKDSFKKRSDSIDNSMKHTVLHSCSTSAN